MSGIVQIPYVPDSTIKNITQVSLQVDTTIVGTIKSSPYNFSVNTTKWSKGKHILSFLVYIKDPKLGILDLINTPYKIFTFTLSFDNTAPTAPTNVNCIETNKHTKVFWTPTKLNNFYSYVIRRNGTIIATINNQKDSTYIDENYILSDYYKVNYEVGAATMSDVKYSNAFSITKGTWLRLNSVLNLLDGLSDRVVFFTPDGLTAVSANTCTILTSSNPPDYSSNIKIGMMALNYDRTSLFLFWNNYSINKYSALNLYGYGQISTLYQPGILNFVVGINDSMMVSTQSGYLYSVNRNSQKLRNQLVKFASPTSLISISLDGKKLIAADKSGINKYSIDQNATNKNLSVNLVQQSAIRDSIRLLKVDWDNSRIFTQRQTNLIESWNTETFNFINSFNIPAGTDEIIQIKAINADFKHLYAACTIKLNNNRSTLLVEYDASTGKEGRRWKFDDEIQSISLSTQGRYLFACSSNNQWIVEIGDN